MAHAEEKTRTARNMIIVTVVLGVNQVSLCIMSPCKTDQVVDLKTNKQVKISVLLLSRRKGK
jgi:hypothetical protein